MHHADHHAPASSSQLDFYPDSNGNRAISCVFTGGKTNVTRRPGSGYTGNASMSSVRESLGVGSKVRKKIMKQNGRFDKINLINSLLSVY